MGDYLSKPKTDKHSEDGENDRLCFGLSSMQGWRISMEDAHAAVPNLDDCTSFFGVYDGHGGKTVAKFCAKYLHTQFVKDDAYAAGDMGTSLQNAFFRMDEMMQGQRGWRELAALDDKASAMVGGLVPEASDLINHGNDWALEEGPHSDFIGPSSGSTACVAVIRNNQLVVANAGDSRCVISRNGKAYNLSMDHKPEIEAEKERIKNAGGFILYGRVNGSLNLSRAIGDMEMKQNEDLPREKQMLTASPDINIVELCDDNDFIVLACDGIWECMSSQEVVDFVCEHINKEPTLSAVCEKLLDKCITPRPPKGGGTDNMTIIVVQLKPISSVSNDKDQSTESVREPDNDGVGEPNNDGVGEPAIDRVVDTDSNIS